MNANYQFISLLINDVRINTAKREISFRSEQEKRL